MNCQVVNLNKKSYDIYIGRPGKWGNPFSSKEGTLAEFKVTSRTEAIEKHREWIIQQPFLMESLIELKNKKLGCFCKPKSCHGDTLVEFANQSTGIDLL